MMKFIFGLSIPDDETLDKHQISIRYPENTDLFAGSLVYLITESVERLSKIMGNSTDNVLESIFETVKIKLKESAEKDETNTEDISDEPSTAN